MRGSHPAEHGPDMPGHRRDDADRSPDGNVSRENVARENVARENIARERESDTADSLAEPLRLPPLLSRRHNPWLLVEVDGSTARHGALVWALREAARREATVLAVTVLDDGADHPLGAARPPSSSSQVAALQLLEAQVLRAIAETGVHGRVRTAVLERPVFEALDAAAAGADLVIVRAGGKTLLRPAMGRPPFRRLSRGA